MLLKSFTREIVRAECNPSFESVHCIARLDQNIEPVLPYLNTVLGGFEYLKDPPAVVFKSRGRLITVQGQKIAINALEDAAEADKILAWLQREINDAWGKHDQICPSYEGAPKPKVIEILKLLPKTNCRKCGQPTCMVFATRVAEGIKGPDDCPDMDDDNRASLGDYMSQFHFEG